MRRGAGRAVFACAVLSALAGCGPEGAPPPRIEIGWQSRALLSEADRVAIFFYADAAMTCTEIREQMPRPESILGPFLADLDAAGRESGILFRQDGVPVGTYVLFVDAYDVNGGLVGTGCAPGQRVLEQEVSNMKVTVRGV